MTLTPEQFARLSALARVMIPGGAGMPGWDDLSLSAAAVERVLAIEPSWGAGLQRFLALTGPVTTLAQVEALAQADTGGFQALGVVLANAYFMDARVRAAIGYPGQEARDSSLGLTEQDLEMVALVAARGPKFRRA